VTFGIFLRIRPIANALPAVKPELKHNEWLKALFPEVLWHEPRRSLFGWAKHVDLTRAHLPQRRIADG